jgi:maltokinase
VGSVSVIMCCVVGCPSDGPALGPDHHGVAHVSLLEALQEAWPPAEDAPVNGYRRMALASTRPLVAMSLGSTGERGLAVVVAQGPFGRLTLAPLVREGTGWRRARPRDGASAALVAALASGRALDAGFELVSLAPVGALHGERAIGVDQTNESVVVGGSVVVKWLAEPALRPAAVPDLQAHLAAVRYRGVPRPLGSLVWSDATRQRATLAFLTEWLPDARDGWDWCVQDLLEHLDHLPGGCPADCAAMSSPAELGRLTAGLHLALATPSDVIPMPSVPADAAAIRAWAHSALGALEDALDLLPIADRSVLAVRAPGIRDWITEMTDVPSTVIQHIHGDLHVGQVLRSERGLAVIDLDDDISIDVVDRGRPLPVARDVAQMSCSLDHVGRVADLRTAGTAVGAIEGWIRQGQVDFLDAYRDGLRDGGRADLLDERLLKPMTAERICRELVYAARVLPRWLYAPMGTLRHSFPG